MIRINNRIESAYIQARKMWKDRHLKNKASKIVSIVTKAVLDRRLLPGTKLGEREIAEVFGSSRVIVRQALIELADGGLINLQHHKGAYVASPSLGEALEIYEALTMVETAVAESLIERGAAARMGELRHLNERQRKALEDGNQELADDLGRDFHSLLVRLGRNRTIEEFHIKLTRKAALLSSLYTSEPDSCGFAADHEQIMDLIERGEVAAVKRCIQTHNSLVARSFNYDEVRAQTLTLTEALQPYLDIDRQTA